MCVDGVCVFMVCVFMVLVQRGGDSGYGFKRFVRDGHHTVKENPDKRFYDVTELTVRKKWCFFVVVMLW